MGLGSPSTSQSLTDAESRCPDQVEAVSTASDHKTMPLVGKQEVSAVADMVPVEKLNTSTTKASSKRAFVQTLSAQEQTAIITSSSLPPFLNIPTTRHHETASPGIEAKNPIVVPTARVEPGSSGLPKAQVAEKSPETLTLVSMIPGGSVPATMSATLGDNIVIKCRICLKGPINPIITLCGHMFCQR